MDREETWTVDRLEGDVAVIERQGGGMVNMPVSLLPAGIGEGDLLAVSVTRETELARVVMRRDPRATAKRAAEVDRLAARLKGRDPGGDLSL